MNPKISKFLTLAKTWTKIQKHKHGLYFLALGGVSLIANSGIEAVAQDSTSLVGWAKIISAPVFLYCYYQGQKDKLQKPEFIDKHTELKEQMELAKLEFLVNKTKQFLEDSIALKPALINTNTPEAENLEKIARKKRLNKI